MQWKSHNLHGDCHILNVYIHHIYFFITTQRMGNSISKLGKRRNHMPERASTGQMGHKLGGITVGNYMSGRWRGKLKLVLSGQVQVSWRCFFTHRHRRTVSALHWRWGEGRKSSERSRACSHTSRSYSTRGPGTHSHLQRAPQTLVTVGTSAWGRLLTPHPIKKKRKHITKFRILLRLDGELGKVHVSATLYVLFDIYLHFLS